MQRRAAKSDEKNQARGTASPREAAAAGIARLVEQDFWGPFVLNMLDLCPFHGTINAD
jgi:hypothetical protein